MVDISELVKLNSDSRRKKEGVSSSISEGLTSGVPTAFCSIGD